MTYLTAAFEDGGRSLYMASSRFRKGKIFGVIREVSPLLRQGVAAATPHDTG